MDLIPLPNKINYEKVDDRHGVVTIEPCYKGYGTTLGNALRRVLLSSMPGAAVTALKIKGVDHEFSSVENVKEDVVEIILNFKQLRVKLFTDEEVRLTLKVNKSQEVLASDIESNSNVEIANPELKLFTSTSAKAGIEFEIIVNKGRGFIPTETREKEKLEVGVIAIDSVYTPIRNVGYKVENVRVGQMTDYEKVILDIETDGTIDAMEAVKISAGILTDHFSLFNQDMSAPSEKIEEVADDSSNEE